MTVLPDSPASDVMISFSHLLKRAVVDANGESSGRLEDATIELRENQYPLLTGLVIEVGGKRSSVAASDVVGITAERIQLRGAGDKLAPFERRHGDVFLKRDVLGHRLLDVERNALVKAYDIRLAPVPGGWAVVALDAHRHRWFHLGARENHPPRDWRAFLLLVGDKKASQPPAEVNRIRRLKAPRIADIIESASSEEQDLLLAQLHTDLELEADVFEELDQDSQARLFRTRSDHEVSEVLTRMRADDVADAIMDLPQGRRRKVLDSLPQALSSKVLTLLGHHPATAGGLMGTDYLAVSEEHSIADAIQQLRVATTQHPEALTTIHSVRADGTLGGTLLLVRALQLDPATALRDVADPDSVVAIPEDDLTVVARRMADFNLLTLPVLDAGGRILGIVTVDDVLEATIPQDWSRRSSVGQTPQPLSIPSRRVYDSKVR